MPLSDETGDERSTTQRTLDMLKAEWQREERQRLAALVEQDFRLHDDTGHPRDEGYMECFNDVMELLGREPS